MSVSLSEYVRLARFLSEHRLPKSAPEPGCQEGLGKAFRRQDGSPFGRCLFGVNTMSADCTAAAGTKPPATDVCRTAQRAPWLAPVLQILARARTSLRREWI